MSSHEEQTANEIARIDKRIDDLELVKLRETGRVLRKDIDLIVPVSHSEIFISSSSATTISDTTTFFLVAGTYTQSVSGTDFTHSGGRLTYTGDRAKMFHIFSSWSFLVAAVNQDMDCGIRKNGTIVTASVIGRRLAVTNDLGSSALHSMITLKSGDIIDCAVRNTSNENNSTFNHLNLAVFSLPDNMTGIAVP